MLLHASHAANHGHHKILLKTVDTDVVVLAVSVAQGLQPEDELWLAFGTGKSFRYLAAHEIAAGLGPEKAQALPMFHALTGCDTVSSFAGHGKKTAWTIWTVLPELTDALLKLSSAPSGTPDDVMHTIERFVILLYDRTSTCKAIDKGQGPEETLREEEQRAADPPNQGSSGGACEEGGLPRRPCVGSNTATNARAASSIQLGLGQE